MYTLQIRHERLSVVRVFVLLLDFFRDFSFLKLSGTRSHIFSASDERLSLPKYTEFAFTPFRVNWLLRL